MSEFAYNIHGNGVAYLTAPLLSHYGVTHAFTARGTVDAGIDADFAGLHLGMGDGGDDCGRERAMRNYGLLGETLGININDFIAAKQVHGTEVIEVSAAGSGRGITRRDEADILTCDGLITSVPNTCLTARSADCVIILFYDPRNHACGVCHAGWKGTAAGIAAETVRRMAERFGSSPTDIVAATGPCIQPCCFETDENVPQAMRESLGGDADAFIERRGAKYHVSLPGINATWLRRAGLTDNNIALCGECTCCDAERYYSHRRQKGRRGLQAGVIALL